MEGPPWYNGLALVVGGSSAGVLCPSGLCERSGGFFYAYNVLFCNGENIVSVAVAVQQIPLFKAFNNSFLSQCVPPLEVIDGAAFPVCNNHSVFSFLPWSLLRVVAGAFIYHLASPSRASTSSISARRLSLLA